MAAGRTATGAIIVEGTRTGLSRSTIYQYIKDGVFPKPAPPGPRAVGRLESGVSECIAARVTIARDGGR